MNLKNTVQIYLFFLIGICLFSCLNKKDVDVSAIDLEIKIERFDQEMSSLTPQNFQNQLPALQKKYGFFYQDYMEGMLSVGDINSLEYHQNLKTVLSSPDYKALKDEVAAKFPDMKKHEEELSEGFKHIKYYYPKQSIPRIITFFSGFTVQTPIGDNYIGVGLDMFLGSNSKFYPALRSSVPAYISRRFTAENITPRVMEAFTREELFPESDQSTSLLQKMIYNGKILFFMDAIMPEVPDSLKIGYTSIQQKWADEFESGIWGYFLQENLLYETDYMKIQKYLTEAPFTPGVGEKSDSAPKLANVIGGKIVKQYMERNSAVTLQELMKDTDAQKILEKAKYHPD
ncbi:MAG TPA: gliding motility lipoprotein GldB [Pedobacter sp.]